MDLPPIIEPGPVTPVPPVIARWRTVLMLLLMGSYPLVLGIAGARLQPGSPGEAALPSTVAGLLLMSAENVGLFGLLFLAVWWVGRPSRDELWLRSSLGVKTWALGFGYSVALRAGIAVLAMVGLVVAAAVLKVQGKPLESLAGARPQIENLLDPEALRNPLYLFLSATLLSFVVAGLREELWRAVVCAALLRLLPAWRDSVRGRLAVVGVAAVVFGLGHLPQGWGGVLLTGALGVGLGSILVFHRSLWIAVLAHGFFDASSMLLIRVVMHFGLLDQVLGKTPPL